MLQVSECSHLCGANENTFQFFKGDSWADTSIFGWTLQCCQRSHFAKAMANAMDLLRNRRKLSRHGFGVHKEFAA